ncbi:ankyrin [Anaeromyces robustus]|uniref:Ankyrin n=1 Tax=Anaeromyces robustus TaxID=1754192 RepID=A0A1Y1WX08_9FUNG|nr:ankyrin [Anaeromyces robustus]|eukprot:ORX77664.1 ankyrin [Anaeromyces robustus]
MDNGIDVLISKINDYSNYLSPLIFAIQRDNRQIVEFLVENGADVNMKIWDNYTPLGVAIFNRKLDLVQYLIEHGANINKAFFRNELPLNIAIESNDKKVLKFLIHCGIDVNNRDNEGLDWYEAPLGKASLKQDLYVIKYLVEYGADIKNDVLNSAVQSGNTDIVNYFIGCGANVNEKGHNYYTGVPFDAITPLYLAIVNNDLNMVECLIHCGATIDMNDQFEDSHLNGAIIAHRVEMVEYLVNWVIINSKQKYITFTGNAYLINQKYNLNEKYHLIYLSIKNILDIYAKIF